MQNEEDYYNSDDLSESEYEMSQNTSVMFPDEGDPSRNYDDEYSAPGDAGDSCEYLFCLCTDVNSLKTSH